MSTRTQSSSARALAVLLALLVVSPSLPAQQYSGTRYSLWGRLDYLRADQKVKVVRMNQKKIKGKLVEVREDSILLRRKKKTFEISREEVFQVFRRQKFNRGKRVAKGLGLGAAAGFILPLALFCGPDDGDCCGPVVVVGAFLGLFTAIGGAVVGAIKGATDKPRYFLVYEALDYAEKNPEPAREAWTVQP